MWYLATGDNLIKPYIEGGDNMDKKLTDEQIKELAREKQREYQREWRRNNPDKVRKYNQSYWRRRAIRELKESKKKDI
jgi:hypothetical protein